MVRKCYAVIEEPFLQHKCVYVIACMFELVLIMQCRHTKVYTIVGGRGCCVSLNYASWKCSLLSLY
jgi:hypothetical protein